MIYFGAVVLDHQYMAAHKISSYAYRLTNTQTNEYTLIQLICVTLTLSSLQPLLPKTHLLIKAFSMKKILKHFPAL